MKLVTSVALVACAGSLLVSACGSSSGGAAAPGPAGVGGSSAGGAGASAGGSAGQSGQPISQMIVAAVGGTLSAPGISVVIPPGALSADTTVTLAPLDKTGQPDAANVASKQVFDLGPNGTTFAKPVTLTLDYDASAVAAGKVAKIAYLDKGAWVALSDSAAGSGTITATTTHFTIFGGIGQMGAGGAAGAGGGAGAGGATGGSIDGMWIWNTVMCGSIDIKAYAMGLGIQSVGNTFSGSSAQVIVTYPDGCVRTNQMTVTFPSPGTLSLDEAGAWTCSAGCPMKECTPGTNGSKIDTYSYSVTGTTLTTTRTLTAADLMGSLDMLAGCKAGDVEVSTQNKL